MKVELTAMVIADTAATGSITTPPARCSSILPRMLVDFEHTAAQNHCTKGLWGSFHPRRRDRENVISR
jgi:hypothetical protein